MAFLRQLYQRVLPFRGRVVLAFALATAACVCTLVLPFLIRGLVDGVDDLTNLIFLGAAFAFVLLGHAGMNLGGVLLMGSVGLRVAANLRHETHARLQHTHLSYFDRTPVGAIIARLMDDVQVVQNLVSSQSLTMLTDCLTAAAILVCLLRSPLVLLAMLTLVPAYVMCFRFFARRIRTSSVAVRSQLDEIFSQLKQKCDGVLVVKAHACEEDEIARFSAQIGAAHEARLQLERMTSAFSNVNLVLSGVGSALVFAVAALEASVGRMTPGEVVLVASLAALVFAPIARLADLASVFEQARVSMGRLDEILQHPPAIAEQPAILPLAAARGLVEFDRVCFHYHAGQPVLSDISIRIEPGMKIAIVGPTGSGKTTLVNLLLRFYDATQGEIRIDGAALGQIAVHDLRKQIGVVAQEPVIFHCSLWDNLRYGAGDVAASAVLAAARAALVDDIAARLPDGYETLIGDGGHKLSQGERQRVAIARALCKNPALVVLDEATSSLDPHSEALIQTALANLLQGRTSIVIAHRLATVTDADLILVLNKGHIVQMGTHADLLAQPNDLYGQLVHRQFADLTFAA